MQMGTSQLGLTKGFVETKRSLKCSGEKQAWHGEKIQLVPFLKEGGVMILSREQKQLNSRTRRQITDDQMLVNRSPGPKQPVD